MRTRLNLEPTRNSVVLLTGASGVAFLALCGVALFGVSRINAAKAELTQRQAQMQECETNAGKVDLAEERYFNSLKELHYLEKTTSTRAYIPTLLKQLEALGRSVNLKVVAVRPVVAPEEAAPPPKPAADAAAKDKDEEAKPAPKPAKPPYEEQRIDVSFQGSYANALSFLYRLTTFPKIMTVNSVEMSPLGNSASKIASDGRLDIKINVSAFILEGPATPKAPADNIKTPDAGKTAEAPKTRAVALQPGARDAEHSLAGQL